jgi:hypothetical protein
LSYFDKYAEVLNTYDDHFLLVKQVFVRNMQPPEAEAGFDVWVPPFTDMPAFERRIAEEWAPSCRNLTYKVSEYCNLSLLPSQNKWKCKDCLDRCSMFRQYWQNCMCSGNAGEVWVF